MKLQGIFPPIITPFDHNGNIYLSKIQHNVEKWNLTTLSGYVVMGSTGESVMLMPDEKFTVIVLSNVGMRPPGALPDAGDLAHRIAAIWLTGRMQAPDARPDVRIPSGTLDLYVGRYKLDAPDAVVEAMGAYIVVTREGGRRCDLTHNLVVLRP